MNFKDFFQKNTSIMLCVNPSTEEIIDANKSAIDFYGYSNLKNMNMKNINIDILSQNVRIETKHFDHKLANGEIKKVEINSSLIKLNNENVLLLIIHDITSKYELEVTLEQSYKSIFEHTKIGMAKLNIDGDFIDINDSFCEILNYKKEELLNKKHPELTHSADLKRSREIIQQLRDKEFKYKITEKRYLKKNGESIWCRLTLSSIYDTNNEVEFFIAVIEDIESKKFLNERYLSLIENMTNGIIVLESTSENDYKINQINRIALEMDCLNEQEVLSHSFTEVFPSTEKNGLLAVINRVYKSGEAESTPLTFYDDEISGWRENHIYKLKNGEIVLLYKDDTSRKILEETFKKDEKLKKDILNTLPDMIWLKDKEGKYLSCNNKFEKYFGTSEENIIGLTDRDFLSPLAATISRNNDAIAIAKDSSYVKEGWVTYPSGRHLLLRSTKIPLKNSKNEVIGVLGIGKDITKERIDEEQLDLFANIFKSTKEGIVITDIKSNIINVNESFSKITGYSKEEVIGEKVSLLKSDVHNVNFYKYMWDDLKTLGFWTGEVTNKRKNGNNFIELLTINVIKDKKNEEKYYVGLFSDISLIRENEKTLENLAHYDALTSLPNRILLEDRIHQNIYNSRRVDNTFALAFLDLDGFKNINDTYGHDVGDNVLIYVSNLLLNTLRQSDTVSRHGGDEFILILSNLNKGKNIDVSDFFNTLLKNIEKPFLVGDVEIKISASIGIIMYDSQKNYTPEILLKKADDAMYEAKNLGKNRFYITT